MPTATEEHAGLSKHQHGLCEAFLGRTLDRLRDVLETPGPDPKFTLDALEVVGDVQVRTQLFREAAAIPLRLDPGPAAPVLVLVETPFAQQLLAARRMAPPEEIAAIRSDPQPMSAEDVEGLREVASFFTAAFTDEARAATGGKAVFRGVKPMLLGPEGWDGGRDPVGPVTHLIGKGRISYEGNSAGEPFLILIPWEILTVLVRDLDREPSVEPVLPREPSPPRSARAEGPTKDSVVSAPPATKRAPATPPPDVDAPGRSRPTVTVSSEIRVPQRLVFFGSARVLATLSESAGTLEHAQRFSAILGAIEDDPPPTAIVVSVAASEEYLLRLLAALRHHPRATRLPILVLLEAPTRRVVLLCGQLGLLEVSALEEAPRFVTNRLRDLAR